MPANTTPIFTQAARWGGLVFTTAMGRSLQILYTAGANGSRVDGMYLSSAEATDNDLFLFALDAGSTQPLRIFHATVKAGSGNGASVIAGNAFNDADCPYLTRDVEGNRYLELPPSLQLLGRLGRAVEGGNMAAPLLNFDPLAPPEAIGVSILITGQDY